MPEVVQNFLSPLVYQFSLLIEAFWVNFESLDLSLWQVVFDLLLVATIFYWGLFLIRGTRSTAMILGILVLIALYFSSRLFGLLASQWLFDHLTPFVLISVPIIFQPELRQGLERLGRPHRFNKAKLEDTQNKIYSVVETARYLIKNKLGGTIVLELDTPLNEYIDSGVNIASRLSPQLLISIFNKKSPLHDGAVIIRNNRLMSAGSVLPLSTLPNEKEEWGTRHKSALGLSEVTDAIVIVASEERKVLTLFQNGDYTERLSVDKLEQFLEEIYLPNKKFRKVKTKK